MEAGMNNSESFTSQTLHYLMKNRLAVLGGLLVLAVFITAIFAPFIAPHDPSKIDIKSILIGPSLTHPLGTDELGRDVLSRMIWGSRVSHRSASAEGTGRL